MGHPGNARSQPAENVYYIQTHEVVSFMVEILLDYSIHLRV